MANDPRHSVFMNLFRRVPLHVGVMVTIDDESRVLWEGVIISLKGFVNVTHAIEITVLDASGRLNKPFVVSRQAVEWSVRSYGDHKMKHWFF